MSSSQIRASLFGTLSLWRDNEQLDFTGSTSARSLLAYLLVHRSHPQSRIKLAGSFWPEMDEARARRALTQALWRIRNVLPDILDTDTQDIQISETASLWIDIEAFEDLVGNFVQDDTNSSSQVLCQAIELYRGDLLEGIYDDWVLVVRERMRELYLRSLERMIGLEKSEGDFTSALDYALKLSQSDPYREAAHREVMRLYYALDRPEAALSQFETCRNILQDELGLEADKQTRALAQEIATRAPDVPAPYLPKVVSTSTPWSLDASHPAQLPLLGREDEREALIHFMNEAISGMGGIVLIEGEAGIGKTRLMTEIVRDAEWRGVQSLWGKNLEGDISSPYAGIIEALSSGLTLLRINQLSQLIDEIWFRVLSSFIPQLRDELPELSAAPGLTPSHEHDRLVQAFAKLLSAWGQITPVILILDDLHWSNEENIDLLIALAPLLKNTRILVIGTFRGEDAQVHSSLWMKIGTLIQSGIKHRCFLERLSPTASGELIRRSLGLSDAVPLFEKRVFQETQGNPLFILETLRSLHDEGLLAQDKEGDWHTPWDDTTSDYGELPLPQAVERTISTRLARLSREEKAVLSAAAVLGRDFNFSLLSNTTKMETGQVLSIANDLVRRRFLEEYPNAYRFSHDKIRQVAYEAIPLDNLKDLHKQAGESIQLMPTDLPEKVELLAYHFTEGHVWDQAAIYNQKAGDRAKELFANKDAVFHYSQALEALDYLPEANDPILVYKLQFARESILALLGERKLQKKELTSLSNLLENSAVGTPARKLGLALRWTDYWEATSDYSAALEAVQDAAKLATLAGDKDTEHQAHLKWGQLLRHLGELSEAHQHLEISYQLGKETQDLLAQAVSLNARGVVFFDSGNFDTALDHSQRALEIGQPTGDQALLSEVHNNLGGIFQYLADFPAALQHHQQALELRRAMGNRRLEAMSLYNLSLVCTDSGDMVSACKNLEQVCQLTKEIGDRRVEGYGWVFLGLTLERLGELEYAHDAYLKGLDLRRDVGLDAMTNDPLAGLARVATAMGNHTEAIQYANQVLNWIEEHSYEGIGDPLLAYLGAYRALIQAGETERGLSALEDAYALLMKFADNISDPEQRHAYLHDISPGQPIWVDYHEYIVGQTMHRKQVRLPRADAPLGRALLADEWIDVTWTVNTPEDVAIEGKTARRQRCLLRLVGEAKTQGATPTVGNLANVLDVSDRTIKRDLAALRNAGHQIETRGTS